MLCSFPSLSSLSRQPLRTLLPPCRPLRSPPSSRKEKPPPVAHRSPTTADPRSRTPEARLPVPAQAPAECDASSSAAAPAPFAYLPLQTLQVEKRTPSQIPNTLPYFNIPVACYAPTLVSIGSPAAVAVGSDSGELAACFWGFKFKFVRFGMLVLIGAISPYLVVWRKKFSHRGNWASCVRV